MKPVTLSGEVISAAFPFHFALDRDLQVVSRGRSLRKLVTARNGIPFDELFTLVRPRLPPTFEALRAFAGLCLVSVRGSNVTLRGQILYVEDEEQLLFVGSPHVKRLADVEGLGLTFDDFAVHDAVPDLLFHLKHAEAAQRESIVFAAELAAERARLRRSEERYRDVVDSAQGVIFRLDAIGRFTYVNRAWTALTGFDEAATLERPLSSFIVEDAREACNDGLTGLLSGTAPLWTFVNVLRRSDGTFVDVEVSVRLVTAGSEGIEASGTMHDLSGRIASENALREAKHFAEEANRAKGDFLAAFSHEIRTPLNVVVGLTSHILEGTPDPETRHSVERVQANAKILMGLLNNVLDLSKIEAKQMELLHTSFDLIDHVESLVEAQSGQVSGSMVELSLHIDPTVPTYVRGDQVRLGQILTNLLGNAIKFTKQGEVSVTVRCTGTEQTRAAIEIEVRDTGIGISVEDQRHLFERFFQVEGERRIARGTGLGLNIARALAQRMGGTLEVSSALGKGSIFKVRVGFELDDCAPVPGPSISESIAFVGPPGGERTNMETHLRGMGMTVEAFDRANDAPRRPATIYVVDGRVLPSAGDLYAAFGASETLVLLAPGQKLPAGLADAATLMKPVGPRRLRAAIDRLTDSVERKDARTTAPVSGARPRVLFVDDNPDNRLLGELLLGRTNCLTDFANDGAEALAKMATQTYDLVFMDVEMPIMDGFEAAQSVRLLEARSGKHVPIVAITAHALEGFRQRCLNAGMDDYLTKPLAREAFFQVLGKYCKFVSSTTRKSTPFPHHARSSTRPARPHGDSVVLVDSDTADLVPGFLDSRRADVVALRTHLSKGALKPIGQVGHNLRGTGTAYGFSTISDIGTEIERAAAREDVGALRSEIDRLDRYLHAVVWRADEANDGSWGKVR